MYLVYVCIFIVFKLARHIVIRWLTWHRFWHLMPFLTWPSCCHFIRRVIRTLLLHNCANAGSVALFKTIGQDGTIKDSNTFLLNVCKLIWHTHTHSHLYWLNINIIVFTRLPRLLALWKREVILLWILGLPLRMSVHFLDDLSCKVIRHLTIRTKQCKRCCLARYPPGF